MSIGLAGAYATARLATSVIEENSMDRNEPIVSSNRDPRGRVYDYDDSIYKESVTMRGWMDITALRARNPNDYKLITEAGYMSNTVFGILEALGRGLAWGAICNPLSETIAYGISRDSPQKKENYEQLAKFMKKSVKVTFEATLQSGASIFTNPLCHEVNLTVAEGIQGTIISETESNSHYQTF